MSPLLSRTCLPIGLLIFLFCTSPSLALTLSEKPILVKLSELHQADLFAISSDNDAISFYKKTLQAKLQLTPKRISHNRKVSPPQIPIEIKNHIHTLVANLQASRIALTIQSNVQTNKKANHSLPSDQQNVAFDWLMTKSLPTSMQKMMSFMAHVTDYFKIKTAPPKRPHQFDAFAQYLDQRYPRLTGSDDSWVGILEQGKTADISQRLSEYWKRTAHQNQPVDPTVNKEPNNFNDYAQYYTWTRLVPIFKAHLLALAIQAQTEAMQLARQSFQNIKKWQRVSNGDRGKVRLCGKWHWTVHNHQNHGDHSMTIYLGDSARQPTNQPQPAEIKINGNTVYLLWKFPRGFQEDSLLLSNNDKRLEGTFTNSFGPYGSIMGKRITKCKP